MSFAGSPMRATKWACLGLKCLRQPAHFQVGVGLVRPGSTREHHNRNKFHYLQLQLISIMLRVKKKMHCIIYYSFVLRAEHTQNPNLPRIRLTHFHSQSNPPPPLIGLNRFGTFKHDPPRAKISKPNCFF